jgi:hypothetical protein
MNVRIVFAALLLVNLVGCTTPWDAVKHYGEERDPPKAVSDDIQRFIQEKKIPASDVSEIRYGVNGSGCRAVRISQELPASLGQETLEHVVYYDKNNLRKRVRKIHGHRRC